MTELKPCPFCGNENIHVMKMGYPRWVVCMECGARVHGGTHSEKDSIKEWNRRVITKEQWKQVLYELKKCPLFCGHYDAIHGNKEYMYGIATVMEWIAYEAEEKDFMDTFWDNMFKSEEVKDE